MPETHAQKSPPSLPRHLPHDQYTAVAPPQRPYSYSQLSIAEQCPRRYWLTRIARVPQAPPTRALRLGSAIHDQVFEPVLARYAAQPRTFDHHSFGLALEECVTQIPSDLQNDASAAVRALWKWMDAQRWAKWARRAIRPEIGLQLLDDGETAVPWSGDRAEISEGALFRGMLDFVVMDEERGKAEIIDWKTGKNPYKTRDANDEPHAQLATYATMLFAGFPSLRKVKATFFNVRIAAKPEPAHEFERDGIGCDSEATGLGWINSHVIAVESRDWTAPEAWPAVENKLCFFCDYKDGCPAQRAKQAAKIGESERMRGTLTRVAYSKPDSDWKILLFEVAASGEASTRAGENSTNGGAAAEITVKGELANPIVGADYEIHGKWGTYKGQSELKGFSFRPDAPTSPEAIERVLTNLKWFGPVRAASAVREFGIEALNAIEATPDAVASACGMTVERVNEAARILAASRGEQETKAALYTMLGATAHTRVVNAIWRSLGESAVAEIDADPYTLLAYHGIGWDTADSVAAQRGIYGDDERRVRAAIAHTLREAEQDGHTLMPRDKYALALQALGVSTEAARAMTAQLIETNVVEVDREAKPATIQRVERAEEERLIAEELHRIRTNALGVSQQRFAEIDAAADKHGLDESQRKALRALLFDGCGVLTGGPGTGKTTTLRAVLECVPNSRTVALASPTGKAARVMADATGQRALTIHSLLSPDMTATDPDEDRWCFTHNSLNQLPFDVVIIDESSMIDHRLAASLLQAIQSGAWLILIGDADQLPSVGAGQFFATLCQCDELGEPLQQLLPVHRLTTVHRNAGVGRHACASIIRGEDPTWGDLAAPAALNNNNAWRIVMPAEEQPAMLERLLLEWCPAKGFDPRTDIAVLTANSKRHGALCAPVLNERLQAVLNPNCAPIDTEIRDPVAETTWRVGDRLMQTRNNREYGVVNGETFVLETWAPKTQTARLRRDDGTILEVAKPRSELDLQLAYACTVHKAQGSQYPVVIVCVDHAAQRSVLTKQWLYTAVSRFQSFCFVLTAKPSDMDRTISRVADARFTGLAKRLEKGIHA